MRRGPRRLELRGVGLQRGGGGLQRRGGGVGRRGLGVAMQVAFERHVLKPVFYFIGARFETRRLSVMGSYGLGGVNVHRPTSAVAAAADLASVV